MNTNECLEYYFFVRNKKILEKIKIDEYPRIKNFKKLHQAILAQS